MACTFTKTTERPAVIFRLQQETGVARNSAFFNLFRNSEMSEDLRVFLQITFPDNDPVHIISRNNAMRPEVAFLEYHSPYDTGILEE